MLLKTQLIPPAYVPAIQWAFPSWHDATDVMDVTDVMIIHSPHNVELRQYSRIS